MEARVRERFERIEAILEAIARRLNRCDKQLGAAAARHDRFDRHLRAATHARIGSTSNFRRPQSWSPKASRLSGPSRGIRGSSSDRNERFSIPCVAVETAAAPDGADRP
jgi:hypothetical protein